MNYQTLLRDHSNDNLLAYRVKKKEVPYLRVLQGDSMENSPAMLPISFKNRVTLYKIIGSGIFDTGFELVR
jgi:hypothetical protein